MTDLIAKAKEKVQNEKFSKEFINRGKALSPKELEAYTTAAWLTVCENASYDLFLNRFDILMAAVEQGGKDKKKVEKVDARTARVEQAIVKTFTGNPHLLAGLNDLDDVAREGILNVLSKHLKGEHDQKKHNPYKDEHLQAGLSAYVDAEFNPAPEIRGGLAPGEGSEAIALALNMPSNVAEAIGNTGARVNDVLNNHTGKIGKQIWDAAEYIGKKTVGLEPIANLLDVGRLVQQHGPGILRGGIRNYYRYSGNERVVDVENGGSRDATVRKIEARLQAALPGVSAAKTSANNAPSVGYIIDANGNAIHKAVGRGGQVGDRPADHYLPFTLNQLRNAQGGTLIRKRTWGGPTEEDVRTALMLNAKEIVTVSNNGTYRLRLTGEKFGIDGEMPLLLNRVTELKNKHGSRHSGTSNFLESLTLEFPLHFAPWIEGQNNRPGPARDVAQEQGLDRDGFLTRIMDRRNEEGLFNRKSSGSGRTYTDADLIDMLFGEPLTKDPKRRRGGNNDADSQREKPVYRGNQQGERKESTPGEGRYWEVPKLSPEEQKASANTDRFSAESQDFIRRMRGEEDQAVRGKLASDAVEASDNVSDEQRNAIADVTGAQINSYSTGDGPKSRTRPIRPTGYTDADEDVENLAGPQTELWMPDMSPMELAMMRQDEFDNDL